MVTKILNLLENPLLSDSFRQAIKEVLEGILKDHSNDLGTQKKLFDEVVVTIDNQISLEENSKRLQEQLVELAEAERTLVSSLEQMNELKIKLEEKKNELELLTLIVDSGKITVEA